MQHPSGSTPVERVPRMPAVNLINSPANPSPRLSRLNRFHNSPRAMVERQVQKRHANNGCGCISDQSLPLLFQDKTDFQQALKAYSQTRRSVDTLATSDYFTRQEIDHNLDKYAGETLSYASEQDASISDEEIESCGYMGWLSR